MPSISTSQSGAVVRWDYRDALRGLKMFSRVYQDFDGGLLSDAYSIDPFINPGLLSPGKDGTAWTSANTITGVPAGFAKSGNYIYTGDSDGDIHRLDPLSNTVSSGTYPVALSGSTAVVKDVIKFIQSGTEYVMVSYTYFNGSAYTFDVGRFDPSTDSFTSETYLTSLGVTPGTGTQYANRPLPMCIGNRGILYIGEGANVHAIDGTNAATVFTLSGQYSGYEIETFSVYPDGIVIYASTQTSSATRETVAIFWDEVSDTPSRIVGLPGDDVSCGFTFNSTPGVFVDSKKTHISANQDIRMCLYNGVNFEVVASIDGTLPYNNSVVETDEGVFFNAGTDIFFYGKASPDLPTGLYPMYVAVSSGPMTTSSNEIICAPGGTSSSGVSTVNTGSFSDGRYTFSLVTLPTPSQTYAYLDYVKVYWGRYGSGTSVVRINITHDSRTDRVFEGGASDITEPVSTFYVDSITGDTIAAYDNKAHGLEIKYVGYTGDPPIVSAVEFHYKYRK